MTSEVDDDAALTWLDRLLAVPEREQTTLLQTLLQQDAGLHARVSRLLRASQEEGHSQLIMEPLALALDAPITYPGLVKGATLGGYRLLRELGRGGMSHVWLAELSKGPLKRKVALKVPIFMLDKNAAFRFEQERDLMARLSHPGIAVLFDAAVAANGQPFFVLEYIKGQRIDEACNSRRLGLRERLLMFQQVLLAVQHAHRRGIVHRDLKPSNVMVDREGRARLLDFGIAKVLKASSGSGRASLPPAADDCLGTALYAAPEQLQGEEISVATDIYSLGVILFELLAGSSPYGGAAATTQALHQAILHAPPPLPSQAATETFAVNYAAASGLEAWRKALHDDLDPIAMKALQKRPEERYGSVDEFLADLQAFLELRPIKAQAPTTAHRLKLLVRRNLGASVAGAVGGVAAVCLAMLAIAQYQASLDARLRAELVRDFMFDLVGDAEPDERRTGGAPTGLEMVEGAIQRVDIRFADRPHMLGELLAELARMQIHLREAAPAASVSSAASAPSVAQMVDLQKRAVALLEQHAPAGDPAMNKARSYLADSLIKAGQLDDAQSLAQGVVDACRSGSIGCAKARFYAASELGRIALIRGQPQVALDHMRQAVIDCEAGFGARDPEIAMASVAYATTARQAGLFELAGTQLDRAIARSEGINLRRADRHAMQLLRSIIDIDLGRFAPAQARLQRALGAGLSDDRTRLRFQRVMATAQMASGDSVAALATSNSVIAQARPGVDLSLALQVRARAQAGAGHCEEASQDIAAATAGLRALRYGERSMEILRARRFAAEIQANACAPSQGLQALRDLAAEQAPVKTGQEVEFAQTLSLLGDAELAAGQRKAALRSYRAAAVELQDRLPADHPIRTRTLELMALAERAR